MQDYSYAQILVPTHLHGNRESVAQVQGAGDVWRRDDHHKIFSILGFIRLEEAALLPPCIPVSIRHNTQSRSGYQHASLHSGIILSSRGCPLDHSELMRRQMKTTHLKYGAQSV